MLRARVIGSVWASRRLEQIPAGAFLEVAVDGGSTLIAFDVLGSGVGELVLVATGSVAASWFPGTAPPIDALIIGSIDEAPTPAAKSAPVKAVGPAKTSAAKTSAAKTSPAKTSTTKTSTTKTTTAKKK